MVGSMLGAFLTFPGLRLAQTHHDALTMSEDRPMLQLRGGPAGLGVRGLGAWSGVQGGRWVSSPTSSVPLPSGSSCTPVSCPPCLSYGSGPSPWRGTSCTRLPWGARPSLCEYGSGAGRPGSWGPLWVLRTLRLREEPWVLREGPGTEDGFTSPVVAPLGTGCLTPPSTHCASGCWWYCAC